MDFIKLYPNSKTSLENWYTIMNNSEFKSLNDIRKVIPSADKVDKYTVFNIAGNNYRLIAAIHYNRGKVYIRNILTHIEYDRDKWKKD